MCFGALSSKVKESVVNDDRDRLDGLVLHADVIELCCAGIVWTTCELEPHQGQLLADVPQVCVVLWVEDFWSYALEN